MTNTITAIIGGLCTAIPSILATINLNNKNQAIINTRLDENLKLIEYRINELSKKQDKYNNVLGRMAILENDQKNLSKELDSISKRID